MSNSFVDVSSSLWTVDTSLYHFPFPSFYLLPVDKNSSISIEVFVHAEPIPNPVPRPANIFRAEDPPPRDNTRPAEKPMANPTAPCTTIFSAPDCIIRGNISSEDNEEEDEDVFEVICSFLPKTPTANTTETTNKADTNKFNKDSRWIGSQREFRNFAVVASHLLQNATSRLIWFLVE